MKYVLSFLLCLFVALSVFAYELPPLNYYGASYGMNPDQVNDAFIASNFITEAATVENGTFYRHYYSDPDLVYYDLSKNEWFNMAFTTTPLSQLYTRDRSISFPPSTTNGQFKRMIIKMKEDQEGNNPEKLTWTYRLYFDNDRLFAVSVRYEDDSKLEGYKQSNPENAAIHPGYAINNAIFDGVMNEIANLYGGFDHTLSRSFNYLYTMDYNAYADVARKTELTVYYGKSITGYLNFTISYIDSYLFKKVTDVLQKEIHLKTDFPKNILPVDL